MFRNGDIVEHSAWEKKYTFKIIRYNPFGSSYGLLHNVAEKRSYEDEFLVREDGFWTLVSKREIKSHLPDFL